MLTRRQLQDLKKTIPVQEIHTLPSMVRWSILRDAGELPDPVNQVYSNFPVGAMNEEGFIWTGRRWVREIKL